MKLTYETGVAGEIAAEHYLTEEKGMLCLERRLRNRCGEIDLVMMDGETVVFVEVKTRRTGDPGSGLMAVNPRKQQRIARAATLYLMNRRIMNAAVRFDVVEVGQSAVIHVPNAFQTDGAMFYR